MTDIKFSTVARKLNQLNTLNEFCRPLSLLALKVFKIFQSTAKRVKLMVQVLLITWPLFFTRSLNICNLYRLQLSD